MEKITKVLDLRKRITPKRINRETYEIGVLFPGRNRLQDDELPDLTNPENAGKVLQDVPPLEDNHISLKPILTDCETPVQHYYSSSSSDEDLSGIKWLDSKLTPEDAKTSAIKDLSDTEKEPSCHDPELNKQKQHPDETDIKPVQRIQSPSRNEEPCVQDNYETDVHTGTSADQIATDPTSREHVFFIPQSEWWNFKPKDEQNINLHRHLEGGWTGYFAHKLEQFAPSCTFTFKYNQVKRFGSRNKSAPYFRGRGVCRREGCNSAVDLKIKDEPDDSADVSVAATWLKSPSHSSKPGRRPLTGPTRINVAIQARTIGTSNLYYKNLEETSSDKLLTGNFTKLPKPNVIRKAVAECVEREKLHRDFVQEVELLKNAYRDDDANPDEPYAGYIQYIAVFPFTLMFFCMKQVALVVRLFKEGQVDFYLDSTGKVLRNIPDQKRPYLYSIVVNPLDSPPISVADMLTTDHTIPSIAHFLMFFRRAIMLKCPNFRPRKIETDWSYALIQSSLNAFTNMNVKAYLFRSLEICRFKHNLSILKSFTVIHLCCAHMTKTVSAAMRKVSKKAIHIHRFLMKCFVILCNETDLVVAKNDFQDILTVLLSQHENSSQEKALSRCEKRYDSLSTNCFPQEVEDATPCDNSDEAFDNTQAIKKSSPWTALFARCKTSIEENLSHDGGKVSDLFCPAAADIFLDRFMPIYPLWSGLMLGNLDRYLEPKEKNDDPTNETRDSNACVESWFKAVKVDILRNTTRYRPAELVSRIKRSLNGRIKEASNPEVRKPKSKASFSIDTEQEKWSKKSRSKKNFHQPKKNAFVTTSKTTTERKTLPEVPKWGGAGEGVTLVNTCTLDNFLTILHVISCERPGLMIRLQEWRGCGTIECLRRCLQMMEKRHFLQAKLCWIRMCDKGQCENINLFGSEYDVFASYFQKMVETHLESVCSSEACPDKVIRKQLHGCFLSSATPPSTIQTMVDNWLCPEDSSCHSTPKLEQGEAVCKTVLRREEVMDVDNDVLLYDYRCNGNRRHQRLITSLPPVLALSVGDLAGLGYLSNDPTSYSQFLQIGDHSYILAGVTLHRNQHFTCCINSVKHGWLFYDGLEGTVIPLSPQVIQFRKPETIIYIMQP